MAKVKLDLGNLTPDEKNALMLKVVQQCSASSKFAPIAAAITGVQTVQYPFGIVLASVATAQQTLKEVLPVRDGMLPDVDAVLQTAADGVDFVSQGNKADIVDSGFEATSDRQPPSPLGQVENFSMTMGDAAGEADWHCSPLERNGGFQAEWTLTPGTEASWKPLAIAFPRRSKGTFAGLPSGQVVTTRLRGTGGTEGTGPWSALASCLVP